MTTQDNGDLRIDLSLSPADLRLLLDAVSYRLERWSGGEPHEHHHARRADRDGGPQDADALDAPAAAGDRHHVVSALVVHVAERRAHLEGQTQRKWRLGRGLARGTRPLGWTGGDGSLLMGAKGSPTPPDAA